MADDFAVAAASPRPIRIGGAEYLVGKFTPRDLGDLQAWLKEQVPDPRLKARELCRDLPDAVALQVWKDLREDALDWPPSFNSREGSWLLTTTHEGAARVLWVLLRQHNEGVDLVRARELVKAVSQAELNLLIDMGFPEPTFDPKAPTTPTTEEDRGPVPMAETA